MNYNDSMTTILCKIIHLNYTTAAPIDCNVIIHFIILVNQRQHSGSVFNHSENTNIILRQTLQTSNHIQKPFSNKQKTNMWEIWHRQVKIPYFPVHMSIFFCNWRKNPVFFLVFTSQKNRVLYSLKSAFQYQIQEFQTLGKNGLILHT